MESAAAAPGIRPHRLLWNELALMTARRDKTSIQLLLQLLQTPLVMYANISVGCSVTRPQMIQQPRRLTAAFLCPQILEFYRPNRKQITDTDI